jgi:glycosyltransferase involved in cell wall biosynthesis
MYRDPFWGFALPRHESYGTRFCDKLDQSLGDPEISLLPLSVIDAAPEFYVVPDHLDGCVLVRSTIARDFGPLPEGFDSLWGAIRELQARARQSGFRTVVANRAFVRLEEQLLASTNEERSLDLQRVQLAHDEAPRVEQAWRNDPVHEYESLLARASSFSAQLRKSLLVELSDLGPEMNGTTVSVLGILDGMAEVAEDWKIDLLVPPHIADHHSLAERYPKFALVWPDPDRRYTAVFRPMQPWSIAHLTRIHRLGLFNFVMMHDTILVDVVTNSPPRLEVTMGALGRLADGIIYNSSFSKERFRNRFPVAASVDEHVSRHSFDPRDYRVAPADIDSGGHIFVIGNDHPHKWMRPTVDALARAFPMQKLKALGYTDPSIPQLEGLASGHVDQSDVGRLFSEAKAIVYPSQYEGFGFPVIQGLSNGGTVIARRSELLREIAGLYSGPGRLLEYESIDGLIRQVGAVLHGHPVDPLPLGGDLAPGQIPATWRDVASGIIDFFDERGRKPSYSNWQKRQHEFGVVEAHLEQRG